MSKTLGIAFGGSGTEGIACVAYVRALEAADVKPDIVSGTGIGGVVAAMYAAGMTSRDMIAFLEEINFPGAKRPINAAKIKDAKYGILDGMGLEEYYQMIVPVKVFDRLYFPLKIVAANYETGSSAVFSRGDVGPAIRAAVSVPGIFSPHEVEGEVYIDGSCVNPVPFDIIRDECDVLAALDAQIAPTEAEGAPSLAVYPAMTGAYSAAKKALAAEKQKSCHVDFYENIAVQDVTMYDFARFDEIIASVNDRAEAFASALSAKLK